MKSRGADRPDDEADERNDQTGRSRRLFGRPRPEPVEPEEIPQEETGWLDDLRTAKEQRAAIGPGTLAGEAKTSKSGRVAPGPRDGGADDAEPPARRGRRPGRQSGEITPPAPAEPAATDVSRALPSPDSPSPYRPAGPPNSPGARPAASAPYPDAGSPSSPAARPAASAPYPDAGPPPAAPPFGRADITGRPISPSAPGAAPGRSWTAESGEHPSGSWRTVGGRSSAAPTSPGSASRHGPPEPGRHTSELNPDPTFRVDDAPGHGRRQIDRDQAGGPPSGAGPLAGPSSVDPTSAVPLSGNAPAVPPVPPVRPAPVEPPPRGHGPGSPAGRGDYLPGTTSGARVPGAGRPASLAGPDYGTRPPAADYTPGSRPPATDFTPGSRPPATDFTPGSRPPATDFPAGPRQPGADYRTGAIRGGPDHGVRPGAAEPGNGPIGADYVTGGRPDGPPTGAHHSGEYPLSDYPEDGSDPGRPGGSSRPVSAMPSADGSSFGSRNTGFGARIRPGVANPEGYRGAEPSGRHGAPGNAQRSGPINPAAAYPPGEHLGSAYPAAAHQAPQHPADGPGDRTGPRPGGRGPQTPSGRPGAGPPRPGGVAAGAAGAVTGMGAAGPAARATASVAPPVVPGRQGVRKPAVPGRAGAMADSPSGVIQRPGETTGRGPNRGTGRVPRPGTGQPRPGMAPDPQAGARARAAVNPDQMPSGRVRPGAVDDGPSGRVRPGAVDDAPSGRVRPGAVDDSPSGRGRPGAIDDAPSRRMRSGGVDQAPSGRVRPGALDDSPSGPIRPGALDDSPSGWVRPGTLDDSPSGRIPPGGVDQPPLGPAGPGAVDDSPSGRIRPGYVDDSPSGRVRAGTFDQPPPSRGRLGQSATGAVTGRARPGTAAVPPEPGTVTGAASAGLASAGLASGPIAPGWSRPGRQPGYEADEPGYGTGEPGYGSGEPGYGSGEPGYGTGEPVTGFGTASVPGDDRLGGAPARGTGQISGRGTGRVSRGVSASAVHVPSDFDGFGGADDGPAPIRGSLPSEDEDDRAGGLRGAPSELRRQMRAKRRLRVVTLVSLSVVVLGLLPLIFGIRAATRDPVFTSIDTLDVPSWAAGHVQDQSSGSRWCFLECRFRERTAQSQRPFTQTGKVYSAALVEAGWQRWKVGGCPDQPIQPEDGVYTCWRRDEFTLDLWVRLPECAVDARAAQDPAAIPSTGANGLVPTQDPKTCVGSTVSIKVQNAITDTRGKTDVEKPGLTGETPDPVLSNDPLLPTPSPS